MNYFIQVSSKAFLNKNSNSENFNITEGFTMPVILLLIGVFINVIQNLYKTANQQNINEIIKQELQPLTEEIKQIKENLEKSNIELLKLEGSRETSLNNYKNGLNRIENNMNNTILRLEDKIKELQISKNNIENELKEIQKEFTQFKIESAKG